MLEVERSAELGNQPQKKRTLGERLLRIEAALNYWTAMDLVDNDVFGVYHDKIYF